MYSFSGPAEVRGFYQKIRDILHPVLILIFMAAPWILINQQPMILFDIPNRHFLFFGETFYSHDAPLLFFVLILVILVIFIVTALFGRLWCGWSCPQTVFIHSVFNKIERLVLGSYTKRYSLFNSEDSFYKKIKISVVYLVFLVICWILSHSFGAYFLGADIVTKYIFEGPRAHLDAFTVLSIMTGVLFFNFTFFREKFCFFICPYGRFQNSLIDRNSLTVFYDSQRGEPRGKISVQGIAKGDCVDCNRCVRVCPTKIDIRNGYQSECISCGICVDACNEVMMRTGRHRHLIRYETGNQKKITLKRFRLVLYAILFAVFFGGLVQMLSNRSPVDFNVARAHQNPFTVRSENNNQIIQNQVQLHLKNQTEAPLVAHVSISEKNINNGFRLSTPAAELKLEPGQDAKIPAFIEINKNNYLRSDNNIEIILRTENSQLIRAIKFIRVE